MSAVIVAVAATVVGVAYSTGLLAKPTFTVRSSTDSGHTDSGHTDSGRTDSGRTDSGHTDSGKKDSGKKDSGKKDSGKKESGQSGKGDTTLSQEAQNAIDLTNAMRRQQSLNPVTHDDGLAERANNWAQWLATHGQMCHPVNTGPCEQTWPTIQKYIGGTARPPDGSNTPVDADGQNIAYKAGSGQTITLTMSEAVEDWYNECQCCAGPGRDDCKTMTSRPENGHYTQLMWPDTLKVGFGKATGTIKQGGFTMDAVWVVCNYSPAGNVLKSSTQFADNTGFKGLVQGQQCPWGAKDKKFMSDACCGSPCYGNPLGGEDCESQCS